jgi:hypothetical protein
LGGTRDCYKNMKVKILHLEWIRIRNNNFIIILSNVGCDSIHTDKKELSRWVPWLRQNSVVCFINVSHSLHMTSDSKYLLFFFWLHTDFQTSFRKYASVKPTCFHQDVKNSSYSFHFVVLVPARIARWLPTEKGAAYDTNVRLLVVLCLTQTLKSPHNMHDKL